MLKLIMFFTALIMPVTAYAEETAPPVNSVSRISWAVKCAGPMPKLLTVSLAVIFVLIIISVIIYRKGGGNDE